MVAMNECKKKCVGLQRTWVSKRTVIADLRYIERSSLNGSVAYQTAVDNDGWICTSWFGVTFEETLKWFSKFQYGLDLGPVQPVRSCLTSHAFKFLGPSWHLHRNASFVQFRDKFPTSFVTTSSVSLFKRQPNSTQSQMFPDVLWITHPLSLLFK